MKPEYGGAAMTEKGFKRKLQKPKQAGTGLQESDDEFHEIMETCIEIIFDMDLKKTVEYISPVIEKTLGYDPYEVIGKNLNNFVLLSDLPEVDDAFQTVISKEKTELRKIRVKSKDGKNIPLEIKLLPIINNQKVIGVHGIARVIAFAEE